MLSQLSRPLSLCKSYPRPLVSAIVPCHRYSVAYNERTFIMVKPDGVQRGLISKVIQRFEVKGFKLVAMKFVIVSTCLLNALNEPTTNYVCTLVLVIYLPTNFIAILKIEKCQSVMGISFLFKTLTK